MNCKKCRWREGSYHCMGCDSYNGDLNELETFCGYCNYEKGSNACTNCVWHLEEAQIYKG